MMRGVRASSMMESTSSTMAKKCGRCTICARSYFRVVAQVVEAQLVVGGVGDVAVIGGVALGVVEAMDDDAGGEAQEAVELGERFRIALGEVVVHGHHVDALAGECVEVDRQGGHEGLASPVFISAMPPWCSTMPPMSCTSNGRMPARAWRPRARWRRRAPGGRRGSCRPRSLAELARTGAQGVVGEGFQLFFQGVDGLDPWVGTPSPGDRLRSREELAGKSNLTWLFSVPIRRVLKEADGPPDPPGKWCAFGHPQWGASKSDGPSAGAATMRAAAAPPPFGG